MPAFAFSAKAGTHLPTPEGWKTELALALKVSQHRCDVLIPRRSMYKSGDGVEHRLKSTERGRRKCCECCVAVDETWHNERHDQRVKHEAHTERLMLS